MKIRTCTKQSGWRGRGGVLSLLLIALLCSIAILSLGGRTTAGAEGITYDYKIENSTGTMLKVTDKNGTAISGSGLYQKLPDAVAAITSKKPNDVMSTILLGDGVSTLQVTVDYNFNWGYVGIYSAPIGHGMVIQANKPVTLLGNMEVAGANCETTQGITKHTLTTSSNDTRYATCIEVGTREDNIIDNPIVHNINAKVTLNCNIKMIAPQAVGPMDTLNPQDKTYQQSVLINHGGMVNVNGGSYSTVVSDNVRNVIMPDETDAKRINTISELTIFRDFYWKGRADGKNTISGGKYVTDVNAFEFVSPADISNITVESSNGTAVALNLAKNSTLSSSVLNCSGTYKTNYDVVKSLIYVNNTFDSALTFTARDVTVNVDEGADFFPIGLRSMGKSVLTKCSINTKGTPAVMQFDKSVEATDCTFISDNDGSQPAGTLNIIRTTAGGIQYGDWNTISNAYGTFSIATPYNDPTVYYTKFNGVNIIKNTSVSPAAYGIASAKVEPTARAFNKPQYELWNNPDWSTSGYVTWTNLYDALDKKKISLSSTLDADQPFILRTKACANIFMNDNLLIDSKAANIYCTDLDGFKINALPSYNTNSDNKIVTLEFTNVGENNVAVYGTTNAQMFKLISTTHSLRVGTGANDKNLVMFAGVTLNVFSATVKGGYVYATCGFLDSRVDNYEVWIGTKVNADETLEGEKQMTCDTPDSLGQFVAKIKLESGDKGKRVIQLRYHSVGDKRSIATLLITILKTDIDGNLTGDVDFGELGAGDKLEYKKEGGGWGDFNGTIPDDALLNSENQIELKYTPSGGESFVFNAEAAPREEVASGVDPLTGKISKTNNSVTVQTTAGFEYRLTDMNGNVIPNCSWTAGADGKVVFTGLNSDTEYKVEAHKKGTATTLPSTSFSENVTTLTDAQQTIEVAKADAKNELDAAAAAEKAKIDAMTGLTQNEKDEIKTSIDSAVTDGKADIDSKATVEDIDSAKDTATAAIEQATTDAAKKIVSDYADEVKAAIGNSGLTETEKNAAKAEVDKKVTAANTAIDAAIDGGSLNSAITNGKDGILNEYKEVAKKELDKTAAAEKAKIDAMTGLTTDEKAAEKVKVDSAVTAGKTDIDSKTTVADVKSATDTATAAIKKVTTDAAKKIVSDYADEVKASISNSGLTETEKNAAKAEVDKKVTAANTAIDAAIDGGSLNSAITNGKDGILDEYKKAAKKDLDNFVAGIGDSEITVIIDTAKTNITGAADKGAVDELVAAAKKDSLDKYKEAAKAAIDAIFDGLSNKGELSEELEAAKAKVDIASSFESIDSAEADGILKLQKEDAKARLDKYIAGVSEPQALKVIEDAKAAIDNALTNGEIDVIAIQAESDSFDKYKAAKMKELTEYYNSLVGSGKYNTAKLAELAAVYKNDVDGAWNGINNLTQADGFKKVDEKLAEGKKRLDAIKITSVGSGGIESDSNGNDFEYPDDKTDDELAGKIESSEGMSSNIELQIKKDAADNKKNVEDAIKNGNIKGADGNSLTAEQAVKLLKDKELKATFDVKLVYNTNGQITVVPNTDLKGSYTIRILLPQNMRNIQSLQIVYIDDNGNVEVFETVREGNYIVFTTTHFSSYIILGEPEVNLWWLIILLIVIIVLEIAFILLWHLVFSKKMNGNKNDKTKDDTDTNDGSQNKKSVKTYSIAPVALFAAIIVPSGGIVAIIILALAALGLGAYIVYMLVKTLFKKTAKDKAEDEVACTQAVSPEKETASTEKASIEEVACTQTVITEAKTVAAVIPVPLLSVFRLSRIDVLDRIEAMAADKNNFPVLPFTKKRLSARNCDSFRCGEFWSFGVMFESRAEILKFMLRLDKDYAEELKKTHQGVAPTEFGGGKEWYKIIIDDSFTSKKQVFDILDAAYAYVLKTRYTLDGKTGEYKTDTAQAEREEALNEEIILAARKKDVEIVEAESKRAEVDANILLSMSFKPTKAEVTAEAKKRYGDEDAMFFERELTTKTGLPLADTFKTLHGISPKGRKTKACFAYVYQQKDGGLKVIVKLGFEHAEKLMVSHGNLCRSKFPRSQNWYVFKLDGTITSMDGLFELIGASRAFAEAPPPVALEQSN